MNLAKQLLNSPKFSLLVCHVVLTGVIFGLSSPLVSSSNAEESPLSGSTPRAVSFEFSGKESAIRFALRVPEQIAGTPLHIRSFLLPHPPRFVVDLLDEPLVLSPIDSASHIKLLSVRWGEHPEYRRLVLDLAEMPAQVVVQSEADSFFGELRFPEPLAVGSEFDSPTISISKREISVIPQEQTVSDTIVTNVSLEKRSFVVELFPKSLVPLTASETLPLHFAPRKFDLDPGKSQTLRLISAPTPRLSERSYVLRIHDATPQRSATPHSAEIDIRLLPEVRRESVRLSEIGHTLFMENSGNVQATLSGALCTGKTAACLDLPATSIQPSVSLMVQRGPHARFNGKVHFDTREEQIRYPNL